ncbi:hypothetical protein G7K71_13480 [Desulfofundulus sp. TPOSR]|uniref:hypothetical protein n=1 Tax=Desulfofundulus sp. TPOSR TaxID=2714340 RepID=UPI00140C1BCD|nr:hypothetical protein [Desulfofundulus sp. TPOSR]NHM27969.1 hypothetical protein [Desulfofundulus sp. TPOSR]
MVEGRGIIVQTEDGPVRACSVEINFKAIIRNEERGRCWYLVELGEPLNQEVLVPTKQGTYGIVQAAAQYGAFVDPKLLNQHLKDLLGEIWYNLPQKSLNEIDSDPAGLLVYEQLWAYVEANMEAFEQGQWGEIYQNPQERKVQIMPPVLDTFFRKVGITEPQERKSILMFWRKNNWLEASAGCFSKTVRVKGYPKPVRRYIIIQSLIENQEPQAN